MNRCAVELQVDLLQGGRVLPHFIDKTNALRHRFAVVGVNPVQDGLAQQLFRGGGAEQSQRCAVGVGKAAPGLDEDAVRRPLDQLAKALLAVGQCGFNLLAIGDQLVEVIHQLTDFVVAHDRQWCQRNLAAGHALHGLAGLFQRRQQTAQHQPDEPRRHQCQQGRHHVEVARQRVQRSEGDLGRQRCQNQPVGCRHPNAGVEFADSFRAERHPRAFEPFPHPVINQVFTVRG